MRVFTILLIMCERCFYVVHAVWLPLKNLNFVNNFIKLIEASLLCQTII